MTLGLAMLIGRFWMILPVAGDRGRAGGQEGRRRPGSARCPRAGRCSCVLLIGVIVIVGALTFFPALALGPIVEHFLAQAGKVF